GWRHSLVIVTPDTVLRWQRRRFREYWDQTLRSAHPRPPTGQPGDRGPCHTNGRGQSSLGRSENPWLAAEVRLPRGRAHRLPAHPAPPHTSLADLAHVPDQSRPGSGLPLFLHASHRALSRPVR